VSHKHQAKQSAARSKETNIMELNPKD